MKKLALSALNDLFAAINAAEALYIPADDAAGQASFTRWQAGMQLSKKLNTVRSAKDLFFPQVENLMGFRVSEKQIELIELRDETRIGEDVWARAQEDSLRGLFLRELRGKYDAAPSDEERAKIQLAARFGLAALDGRDL